MRPHLHSSKTQLESRKYILKTQLQQLSFYDYRLETSSLKVKRLISIVKRWLIESESVILIDKISWCMHISQLKVSLWISMDRAQDSLYSTTYKNAIVLKPKEYSNFQKRSMKNKNVIM